MSDAIPKSRPFFKNEDVFNIEPRFDAAYKELINGQFFKIPENNGIIKLFIDAKWKGNYRSIIYQVNNPKCTLIKNLGVFRAIEGMLNKPFNKLSQDDIDMLQLRLNNDEFTTTSPIRKPKKLAFRYKQDIVKHIKQFWRFYKLYAKTEMATELPNIVEYIQVRKPKNQNTIVKFITKDEIDKLLLYTNTQQMRAFLSVYYELGARVVEILLLKRNNCKFDETKKVWSIVPPQEKGLSTQKMMIELSFSNSEFNKWMMLRNFESEEEYIFQYSYDYIRRTFARIGRKYLGRHLSPKEMRKGATMFLVNSNANEQYIRAHMGWSPSSDAINHYINQKAIKKPAELQKAIQTEFYSDMVKENDELKFKQKMQENVITEMVKQLEDIRKEQSALFNKMIEIDVASSKNMLKAVFEELKLQNEKKIPS